MRKPGLEAQGHAARNRTSLNSGQRERGADERQPTQTARGGAESDRQEGGRGAWTEANPQVLQDNHGTEAQRRLGAGGGGQGRSRPRAESLT